MKKDTLIIVIVIFLVLAVITAFAGFCFWLFNSQSPNNQLNFSSTDISFLKSNNFNVDDSNLKSPDLIEQNLNSEDESFEVLATKLNNDSYQLAFKLENKSQQDKDFYLIPVFKENQLQFEEIKGVVNDKNTVSIKKENTSTKPLEQLYDVEKHKKELKPELAQAYKDIENNGYLAKPIKVTLSSQSTFLANSNWLIDKSQRTGGLEPVYFLIYGSAGGVKEELSIITVHSHPQREENWEVSFTTRGIADLKIIPNDQATVDDDEFVSLFCNNEERSPQILEGDIIYYPDWECPETGKIVHYTKKAGKHTLRFEFGKQVVFAYNTSSVPLSVKSGFVVKGGLHIKSCGEDFVDSRDGKTYSTVQVGKQCWMKQNLNVGTKITSCTGGYLGICTNGGDTVQDQGTSCASIQKYCYNDDEAYCTLEGGFYQWNQAMCGSTTQGVQGICPDGWHIPTDAELKILVEGQAETGCEVSTGNQCSPAGSHLSDYTLNHDNSSGFSALLSGYRDMAGAFDRRTAYTYFWSSTQFSSNAWKRALYSEDDTVLRSASVKTHGFSVRCLKN